MTASFTDLVFHVLAHVEVDVPAGAFDATYVRWVEEHLGPASERELGESAREVARVASTHELLGAAQRLAWLFRDGERARPAFAHALGELAPADVDAPAVLLAIAGTPPAELLFCAVALEAAHHARLPETPARGEAFADRLASLRAVAPELVNLPVEHVRALRRRGRLFGGRIWVGLPGAVVPAVEPSLVAWQVAHEATVAELARAKLPFAQHEHAAIALLAARATRAGKSAEHAAWLAGLRAPAPAIASLAPETRAVVVEALERSAGA